MRSVKLGKNLVKFPKLGKHLVRFATLGRILVRFANLVKTPSDHQALVRCAKLGKRKPGKVKVC